MSFLTKEKLALREAIHAMKWLDKHHDGWGLEEECAILENICSNCEENEIKSNHNYLDLQYQLDEAESEIERLQDEIINIKKRSEHNASQDAASARQQMDIIKRLREEIKILKLGDNNEQCTNLDHDCVFQNLNESDAIAIAGAHGKDHYHAEQKVAFCIRNFKGCRRHKCWQITEERKAAILHCKRMLTFLKEDDAPCYDVEKITKDESVLVAMLEEANRIKCRPKSINR